MNLQTCTISILKDFILEIKNIKDYDYKLPIINKTDLEEILNGNFINSFFYEKILILINDYEYNFERFLFIINKFKKKEIF